VPADIRQFVGYALRTVRADLTVHTNGCGGCCR
jgi:hypothetical protein